MKIKQYRTQFIQELSGIYDILETENFFYLILELKRNIKQIDLALNPDLAFSEQETEDWDVLVSELKKEIPIQYLLGKTNFYGLDFEVNPNVLIPRPETEELVKWIISDHLKAGKTNLKILDIGTGSGCIAVSLAKNLPHAQVFAIDISENALATAKRNSEFNNVSITFLQQNILETEDLGQEFDIIVSNPPYVRNSEKEQIKKNVLHYEPHSALFVEDDDALVFYRKIAWLAWKNLTKNGSLYFEINQYLGKETVELLEKTGFKNIQLRKDIYNNDRMIFCEK